MQWYFIAYLMNKAFFLQCKTFLELVESEEDYDSKSVTAVGVLETIGCIVGELDQQEDVSHSDVFVVCLKFKRHVKIYCSRRRIIPKEKGSAKDRAKACYWCSGNYF